MQPSFQLPSIRTAFALAEQKWKVTSMVARRQRSLTCLGRRTCRVWMLPCMQRNSHQRYPGTALRSNKSHQQSDPHRLTGVAERPQIHSIYMGHIKMQHVASWSCKPPGSTPYPFRCGLWALVRRQMRSAASRGSETPRRRQRPWRSGTPRFYFLPSTPHHQTANTQATSIDTPNTPRTSPSQSSTWVT